ncbi:endonuclease domain-containing protein [Spirillospora sp. NPDC048911]|uniref:endonuclease domain-containing protein n=1 Tax=Spirillospora sp. NPDC048911 TaxID=3364527 RepID=UPI00371BC642
MAVSRTLPDHETCGTHEGYSLTCSQYEGLLAESDRSCQICRLPAAETPARKLFIDHDSLHGRWAVRGLLCNSCNTRLEYQNLFRDEVEGYLANAWFLRALADADMPFSRPVEPPIGSIVRDGLDVEWRRVDAWWRPCGGSYHGNLRPKLWHRLWERGGVYRLQVLQWGEPEVSVRLDDPDGAARLLRARMAPDLRKELARLLLTE